MIMCPVKMGNSIAVYKSCAKDPTTKKYKYMALVSIKDYKNTGLDDIAIMLENVMGMGDHGGLTFNNPINDGLVCDLINEFIHPYLNIRDKDVCATFVGKKLMVLEKIANES
jgi:hypothetical protein